MSRIKETFKELARKNKKAFIPFLTAGDPDMETTRRLILELAASGADIIEVGVPFSDPIADGTVIQKSSERALSKGYNLSHILAMLQQVRATSNVPIVLFSYYNPLLQFGVSHLALKARESGVDGLLVTDLTPEESETFRTEAGKQNLDTIFLIAPTSSAKRIQLICNVSSGFIYLVSRTGVTGPQNTLPEGILPLISDIRAHTDLPIAVGFGISNPEQVREIHKAADAAVVGSAIVAKIEAWSKDHNLVAKIGHFVRWLAEPSSVECPEPRIK